MSERSRREAYENGREAFQKGDPLNSNWHGAPSLEHDEWRRGWLDAQHRRAQWDCGCALCVSGGRKEKFCDVNNTWP